MKQIAAYQTSDGQIFTDRGEALSHEARLTLGKAFDDTYPTLCGDDSQCHDVSFDTLMEWAEANADFVQRLAAAVKHRVPAATRDL